MSRLIHSDAPTELILSKLESNEQNIDRLCLGLTWTCVRSAGGVGLAMSPGSQEVIQTRTLSWPGTLAGRKLSDVSNWLRSVDPFQTTIGLATANAGINQTKNIIMQEAEILAGTAPGNLRVFEHFKEKVKGKKVAIIGRYPGLEKVLDGCDVAVFERNPSGEDLPDTAAEFLLPQMDWVFITATSLMNKTFARLAELSKNAVSVLMGPSLPWLEEWKTFNIDYLAGVVVTDSDYAEQVVMEGGGTRLFDGGVTYGLLDISGNRLQTLKEDIAITYERREHLKKEMEDYFTKGAKSGFPKRKEVAALDARLSDLDTSYKRLWDARNK